MTERYLANENFPKVIVQALRRAGDDVLYAADELVAAPDSHVLQAALQQDRVVLTFDQDFASWSFITENHLHLGSLVRIGGLSGDGSSFSSSVL